MRQKNIRRAAEALHASQGDDKNKVLASFIPNKEVRKRVQDQGRALLILERLCLPSGKFSFTVEEIHGTLLRKLEKKGHRIQGDEEEDTEQFAQEKEQAMRDRLSQVDSVLGKTIAQLEQEQEEQKRREEELKEAHEVQERLLDDLPEVPEVEDVGPVHKDEFGNIVEGIEIKTLFGQTPHQASDDSVAILVGKAFLAGLNSR